ncbi:DUF3301 domain-containing protein [Thiohalospira sp.]|uniref:DUF3301 domain-containing protein n=1 Tax=Thiohalospira sp. TaxID=3080549 RepID=UPI00397F5C8F
MLDHAFVLTTLAIGLALVAWARGLGYRERALIIAQNACQRAGVQLLDESVSLTGLRPVWRRGAPALRRTYRFEFSRGSDRRAGFLSMVSGRPEAVWLDHPEGGLWNP